MAFKPMALTATSGAQLRLAYDSSNYTNFTTGSGGDLTIAPTGGDTAITGTLAVSSSLTATSFIQGASYRIAGSTIARVSGTTTIIGDGASLTAVTLGGSGVAVAVPDTLTVTGVSTLTGHVGIGGASSASASLLTKAATTALSSIRIPHGTAPSSPVDGDVWTTTAGLFVRINGSTVGPLS